MSLLSLTSLTLIMVSLESRSQSRRSDNRELLAAAPHLLRPPPQNMIFWLIKYQGVKSYRFHFTGKKSDPLKYLDKQVNIDC